MIIHWILFGILVIMFCASGLGIVYQFVYGLNKTALNDRYVWGLNIQGFFLLSSLGTGILIILAAAVIFMGRDYPVLLFQFGSSIAFSCLLGAQLLLGTDLGKPLRSMRILIGKNPTSPLTIDFFTLAILTLLSIVFVFGILMNYNALLKIWAYAVLLTSLLCLAAHSLLFAVRVPAGYNSQPFLSATIFASSLWGGSAILSLSTVGEPINRSFLATLSIITAFIFVLGLSAMISARLGGRKPTTMFLSVSSGLVLLLLIGKDIIFKELILLDLLVSILPIPILFIEKYLIVIHFQKDPVLPAPYCKFESLTSYRPTVLEIANIICGLSLVGVSIYAILIFKAYILPLLFSFIN